MKFENMADMPPLDVSGLHGMPVKHKNYSGRQFSSLPEGTHFVDCDFSKTSWQHLALGSVMFVRCRFDGARFDSCQFASVSFYACQGLDVGVARSEFRECHWEAGQWHGWQWQISRLLRPIFNQIECRDWQFSGCELGFITFSDCHLSTLKVENCLVRDVSLVDSRILQQIWHNSLLERVIVANSTVEDSRWQACQGINNRWMGVQGRALEYCNCHFEQTAWSACAIEQMNFVGNTLRMSSFDRGVFKQLFFKGNRLDILAFDASRLMECVWEEQGVQHLSFREARLEYCDLRRLQADDFDVRGCVLHETHVHGARFSAVNVEGQDPADWRGAELGLSNFEIPEGRDDGDWWQCYRPGVKGEQG